MNACMRRLDIEKDIDTLRQHMGYCPQFDPLLVRAAVIAATTLTLTLALTLTLTLNLTLTPPGT